MLYRMSKLLRKTIGRVIGTEISAETSATLTGLQLYDFSVYHESGRSLSFRKVLTHQIPLSSLTLASMLISTLLRRLWFRKYLRLSTV